MDAKQSQLIDQYQDQLLETFQGHENIEANTLSDDELLELLDEDDGMLASYREKRIEQLSREFKTIKRNIDSEEFGSVITMYDEGNLMDLVLNNENVLVHFFLDDFSKCIKMDEKLDIVSQQQLNLKILRINVTVAKFLVTKLKIKILPAVICYKKGIEVDRLIGFEKLGNNPNDFRVEYLENYLYKIGLINRKTTSFGTIKQSSKPLDEDSDDDSDI